MTPERWKRVNELFHSALAREPSQRTAFLKEACDDELREQIESLIRSHQQSGSFIDAPAVEIDPNLLNEEEPQLIPESTIAHYKIISFLGRGAMGTVYLAKDAKLGRKVALKLLPALYTTDQARVRRFELEARAASALNHPNILTIFDIDQADGHRFIATEYIEGKTLRQHLTASKLKLSDALDVATQIGSALDAAHQAGIIHRDIKPENLMVRRDGLVKVLDFGLAKLTDSSVAGATTSDGAEEAGAGTSFAGERENGSNRFDTESGLMIGTLPYMSPEQLKGERLDARTDIFSLGVVIYEMLTGRNPFNMETTGDVASAILQEDAPSLLKLLPEVPPELERVVAKSLRKDCTERYQSVTELLADLRNLCKDLGRTSLEARRVQAARSWRWLAWVAVLMLAATAGLYWLLTRPRPERRSPKLSKLAAYGDYTFDPAVSPDGKYLAFASNRAGEGHTDIWVRPLDRDEPTRLTKAPGNVSRPEFSPDGTRIAFERQGGGQDGIYVVSTSGGEPSLVAERGLRPRWSPDGKWLAYWVNPDNGSYSPDSARKIFLLPTAAGEPRQFRPEFLTASFPAWSPDGKYIIFMGLRDREQEDNDWWVAPVEGGEPVKTSTMDIFLRRGLSAPPCVWTTDNYILFTSPKDNGATIDVWRIPLEPGSWKTRDQPEQVTYGTRIVHSFASLPDGRLVFGDERQNINLWSLPVDGEKGRVRGEQQQITRDEADNVLPWLSADGVKLVYGSTRAVGPTLWLRDLKSGQEVRLTGPDAVSGSIISPDGKAVVFVSQEHSSPDTSGSLLVMSVDGVRTEKLIEGRQLAPNGWLFTRNQVLFQEGDDRGDGSPHVFLLDIDTKRTQVVLEHNEFKFSWIFVSPDDRWISFVAFRNGEMRIFIAPLHFDRPAPEAEWVAVTGWGGYKDQPRWSPAGKLLYFMSERDGSKCIWAQRLDPLSKRPTGDAFGVYHFHDKQKSLTGISSVSDKIVFARAEETGSIWLAEP